MKRAKEKAKAYSQKLAFSSHAEMLLAEDAFIAGFKCTEQDYSDYAAFVGARNCLIGLREHISNKIQEYEIELEKMEAERNKNER
jgi:hypothetical protein